MDVPGLRQPGFLKTDRENASLDGRAGQSHLLDSKSVKINVLSGENPRPFLDSLLYGSPVRWLADTGAAVSVLDVTLLPREARKHLIQVDSPHGFAIATANGTNLDILGRYNMAFEIQGGRYEHPVFLIQGLASNAILGIDFLAKNHAAINAHTLTTTLAPPPPQVAALRSLTAPRELTIPPHGSVFVDALAEQREGAPTLTGQTLLCRPAEDKTSDLMIDENIALCSAEGKLTVRICNLTTSPLQVLRGTLLGTCEQISALGKTLPQLPCPPMSDAKWAYINKFMQCGFQEPWRTRFFQLVRKYHDVFSADPFDLGCTDAIEHKVTLTTNRPIHTKQFPVPWAHLETVNTHVTELQKKGCIEPSRSAYNSPIFCVPKHSGELRVVQDFRAINAASLDDRYVIQDIGSCINEIGRRKSKTFSTLDLTNGFWQLVLEKDSRECTAFTVPGRGRFQWKRCPMGLHGSPASFARLMDLVMEGLEGVLTYIDDVLVHAPDISTHLKDLEQAFLRLRKYNLKLNVKKCSFGAKKVPYLGFTLTETGILPDKEKLRAIQEYPPPATPKQVREFTGIVNYFRALIPRYNNLSGQLTKLLTKDVGWKGGRLPPESLTAFIELKKQLCSAPVVHYPRKDLPFILSTDAATGDANNPGGLGAMLSQIDETGVERVVGYASRALTPHERNYSAYLLEMAAASWAVDHYNVFLYGSKFTLRLDHRPLERLSTIHKKTLNRLQQQMSEFNFMIAYRPGISNQVADALSRNPVDALTIQLAVDALDVVSPVDAIKALGLTTTHLRRLQLQDKFGAQALNYLRFRQLPILQNDLIQLRRAAPDMRVHTDGLLYRRVKHQDGVTTDALVLPILLTQDLIRAAHCGRFSGHGGHLRTLGRLQRRYWWLNMFDDIKKFVNDCTICRKSKNPQSFISRRAPIQPLPIPDCPNQRIHVDLFGPLKTSEHGKKYLLCMTDAFTKYTEIEALPNKEAETVGKAIFETWICRYGCPNRIVSDRGPEFTNKMSKHLYKLLGIDHRLTSAFHPQCNSQVESFNREIIRYLKVVLDDTNTLDWESYLPTLRISYNTAVHRTIAAQPFFLTFCHEANLPYFDLEQPQTFYTSDWPTDAYLRLKKSYRIVQENARQAEAERMKNQGETADPPNYVIGEEVMLYFPRTHFGGNRKLAQQWKEGYVIKEQIGPQTFILRSTIKRKRQTVAHADQLKRAHPLLPGVPAAPAPAPAQAPPPPIPAPLTWLHRLRSRPGMMPTRHIPRPPPPTPPPPLLYQQRKRPAAPTPPPTPPPPLLIQLRKRAAVAARPLLAGTPLQTPLFRPPPRLHSANPFLPSPIKRTRPSVAGRSHTPTFPDDNFDLYFNQDERVGGGGRGPLHRVGQPGLPPFHPQGQPGPPGPRWTAPGLPWWQDVQRAVGEVVPGGQRAGHDRRSPGADQLPQHPDSPGDDDEYDWGNSSYDSDDEDDIFVRFNARIDDQSFGDLNQPAGDSDQAAGGPETSPTVRPQVSLPDSYIPASGAAAHRAHDGDSPPSSDSSKSFHSAASFDTTPDATIPDPQTRPKDTAASSKANQGAPAGPGHGRQAGRGQDRPRGRPSPAPTGTARVDQTIVRQMQDLAMHLPPATSAGPSRKRPSVTGRQAQDAPPQRGGGQKIQRRGEELRHPAPTAHPASAMGKQARSTQQETAAGHVATTVARQTTAAADTTAALPTAGARARMWAATFIAGATSTVQPTGPAAAGPSKAARADAKFLGVPFHRLTRSKGAAPELPNMFVPPPRMGRNPTFDPPGDDPDGDPPPELPQQGGSSQPGPQGPL